MIFKHIHNIFKSFKASLTGCCHRDLDPPSHLVLAKSRKGKTLGFGAGDYCRLASQVSLLQVIEQLRTPRPATSACEFKLIASLSFQQHLKRFNLQESIPKLPTVRKTPRAWCMMSKNSWIWLWDQPHHSSSEVPNEPRTIRPWGGRRSSWRLPSPP